MQLPVQQIARIVVYVKVDHSFNLWWFKFEIFSTLLFSELNVWKEFNEYFVVIS